MLYHDVVELERTWQNFCFNKKSFSSRKIIEMAQALNIVVVQDHSISRAGIFKRKNKHIILYNPHQPEIELIQALGHELGHYALGHVNDNSSLFGFDQFAVSGMEKDAGIVGFLFWQPSHYLDWYADDPDSIPERLFNSVRHFSDEVLEKDLVEMCLARWRIYRAFNRVQERIKTEH